MSDKHTPGPWEAVLEEDRSRVLYVVSGPDGRDIADIIGDSADAYNNALLIAAAPDLYEALEAMFDARHSDGGEWTDACLKAKRALAKAKGGAE